MSKHLTNNPIDITQLLQETHSEITGAVVIFSGEVRGINKNKTVDHLEYEAYEMMAGNEIHKIVEKAIKKWSLNHAVCIHRMGSLTVSECAVVVITCSGHRNDAYQANRFIIDQVKAHVPIWKKEVFSDGSFEWGTNDCTCSDPVHTHS